MDIDNIYHYYIFVVDESIDRNNNQGLFEISGLPNGTAFSTCTNDLLYISDDKNKFIIGSKYGDELNGVTYYKKIGGFSNIIKTNITEKINDYCAREKNEFVAKHGDVFKNYLDCI